MANDKVDSGMPSDVRDEVIQPRADFSRLKYKQNPSCGFSGEDLKDIRAEAKANGDSPLYKPQVTAGYGVNADELQQAREEICGRETREQDPFEPKPKQKTKKPDKVKPNLDDLIPKPIDPTLQPQIPIQNPQIPPNSYPNSNIPFGIPIKKENTYPKKFRNKLEEYNSIEEIIIYNSKKIYGNLRNNNSIEDIIKKKNFYKIFYKSSLEEILIDDSYDRN